MTRILCCLFDRPGWKIVRQETAPRDSLQGKLAGPSAPADRESGRERCLYDRQYLLHLKGPGGRKGVVVFWFAPAPRPLQAPPGRTPAPAGRWALVRVADWSDRDYAAMQNGVLRAGLAFDAPVERMIPDRSAPRP